MPNTKEDNQSTIGIPFRFRSQFQNNRPPNSWNGMEQQLFCSNSPTSGMNNSIKMWKSVLFCCPKRLISFSLVLFFHFTSLLRSIGLLPNTPSHFNGRVCMCFLSENLVCVLEDAFSLQGDALQSSIFFLVQQSSGLYSWPRHLISKPRCPFTTSTRKSPWTKSCFLDLAFGESSTHKPPQSAFDGNDAPHCSECLCPRPWITSNGPFHSNSSLLGLLRCRRRRNKITNLESFPTTNLPAWGFSFKKRRRRRRRSFFGLGSYFSLDCNHSINECCSKMLLGHQDPPMAISLKTFGIATTVPGTTDQLFHLFLILTLQDGTDWTLEKNADLNLASIQTWEVWWDHPKLLPEAFDTECACE